MRKLGASTAASSSLLFARLGMLTVLIVASAGLSLFVVNDALGQGVIYAVMDNGELRWNRHDGRGDGSFTWATPTGKVVGTGWNVKYVFSD
jgi:hypothetical protein